ncbi:hypothetical protein EVAR_17831_1 [Eumeta japonica]|uniref:Uncharacterized protein n=1 Tax=Eumeta variegata TaxID=151549 RepID=A0A4C1TTM3_EUMVA|nr:hypothetical protein EVAR_17831_1 [Eumeta japonica]
MPHHVQHKTSIDSRAALGRAARALVGALHLERPVKVPRRNPPLCHCRAPRPPVVLRYPLRLPGHFFDEITKPPFPSRRRG